MKKYGTINDILSLNWLPTEERIKMNIAKLAFKELHYDALPPHLKNFFKKSIKNSQRRLQKTLSRLN